jgi:hypothetical protein
LQLNLIHTFKLAIPLSLGEGQDAWEDAGTVAESKQGKFLGLMT